ncbi:MAG: GH92 family glycosyl hydrolase [Bacteroidales bacterium]|nr:GH92 family glycosyl hydrolase [Bacteroidales bacterium]
MNNLKRFGILLIVLSILSSCKKEIQYQDLTKWVNPFIGTGGHGHTYPGASLPFGMVQLSPDTRLSGWDGCSGYHYSDSVIYGFSHTHLSGTGISDYGDILIMPTRCNYSFTGGNYGYESSFKHENEYAEPGYYSVILNRYMIFAELTATERTGMHKYTFPECPNAHIIIDLKHRDRVIESSIKITGETELVGMRRSEAWAKDQYIYFVVQFSKPFNRAHIAVDDNIKEGIKEAEGKNLKAILDFDVANEEAILLKVGISAVSIEGARKNLQKENTAWDFDLIRQQANEKWNKELNKIQVEGGTDEQKTIFYTAMYHSFLNPNIFMDVDGKYRGTDLKIHQADNFTNYTVFSLWDTFRATHPLFTITQQARTVDFIKTFLHQYENGGQLPVWELAGNYTGTMIAYHSIPVITDAYQKGIRAFDIEKAFEAMKHSADMEHLGLDAYKTKGFIAIDDEAESVSKTLEYAYDDWCIAQVAKEIGKKKDYKRFIQRAQFYKNLFNPENGFMQPKFHNMWKSPFDPSEVDFNYTEANAWQYSFFVPQDIQTLIKLHGGNEPFIKQLDELFSTSSKTTGRQQADITGLIGQYAHGNEPSHHMAYLHNYAGMPWKTQAMVRKIMDEQYYNAPDGLSGNEDCGQMSSWYVFSAMGFYPVTPGSVDYILGTPLFKKISIHLENGNTFTIEAPDVSGKNIYIQSAKLNGKAYKKSFITHDVIMEGGVLELKMGKEPNKSFGSKKEDCPKSIIKDDLIEPVPFLKARSLTFKDSLPVEINAPFKGVKIYYTTDGTEPTENSVLYEKPIILKETTTIKAIVYGKNNTASTIISTKFVKIPKGRKIRLLSKYSKQYTAGGDEALIDYLRGGDDFRDGLWQGYQKEDFGAIVDLGKIQAIHKISTGFLQSIRSWIWMPKEVEYSVSNDGVHFNKVGVVYNGVPDNDYKDIHIDFTYELNNVKARYVKVKAKNYGTIPDWHLGAGGDSWIFVDEIVIE